MAGMDPATMAGLGLGDPGMMGGMGTPGGMAARPKIATSVPIELTIRGTNKAVMEYLYAITHNNRLWSVDALLISANANESDRITARFVVHVISRFEEARLQMSEQEIKEQLATASARAAGGEATPAVVEPVVADPAPAATVVQ